MVDLSSLVELSSPKVVGDPRSSKVVDLGRSTKVGDLRSTKVVGDLRSTKEISRGKSKGDHKVSRAWVLGQWGRVWNTNREG